MYIQKLFMQSLFKTQDVLNVLPAIIIQVFTQIRLRL